MKRKEDGYWKIKKNVILDARKYKRRSYWKKKSSAAYLSAKVNGWFEEAVKHMEYFTKPQKYWNKVTCTKEAKRFLHKNEFRKKSAGAYDKARDLGILDEICSHMQRPLSSKLKYTFEFCKKEVLKYECIEDLRRESQEVYRAILSKGWREQLLYELDAKSPPKGFFNLKKNCLKIALKFKHKKDFQKHAGSVYNASKRNGWFEEITAHMTTPPSSKLKWTKKAVKEEALKYKTKKEFGKKCPGGYEVALKKKWIGEVCKHMQVIGSKYSRCIYSLRNRKEVYIGLSFNFQKRISEHKQRGEHYDYLSKKGKVIIKQETAYLPVLEAQKKEEAILQKYKKNGYNILNKTKTGGLGTALAKHTLEEALKLSENCNFVDEFIKKYPSYYAWIGNHGFRDQVFKNLAYRQKKSGYWTKANCIKAAKSCESKSEFEAKFPTASNKARKHGWYEEATEHMVRPKSYNLKWSKEAVANEALKYRSRKSFSKGSRGAYYAALKKGWIDEVCSHMKQLRKPPHYWTKEKCLKEAQKYSTKAEFRKKASSPYSTAEKNGWLQSCCEHMISHEVLRIKWTFDACKKESLKYRTKIDWKTKGENSYSAACRKGWLPELTKHMVTPEKKIKWTNKRLKDEALKYSTRTKFARGSCGAYESARAKGLLDSICKHM